jgi:uncharacterized YccA/Bax inhibitor family protein
MPNPTLGENLFLKAEGTAVSAQDTMTASGAVNKSFALFALVLLGASAIWLNPARVLPFLLPAMIIGFVVALVTCFKQSWSPVTAPIYAFVEGIVLGGISLFFEKSYPGIVMQAVGLTFATLFCMLAAYKAGWIKVTEKFRMIILVATGAIAMVYLAAWVLSFFGKSVPLIFGSGPIGIGFSLLVVGIAAFNLALDFDFIDKGAQHNLPKYMEWYAAFGLMVTLIWLYIEILRLLSKIRGRD